MQEGQRGGPWEGPAVHHQGISLSLCREEREQRAGWQGVAAFKEQGARGSLSLKVAGARSHAGSPRGLHGCQCSRLQPGLSLGSPLLHTYRMREGPSSTQLGLPVYGNTVAE